MDPIVCSNAFEGMRVASFELGEGIHFSKGDINTASRHDCGFFLIPTALDLFKYKRSFNDLVGWIQDNNTPLSDVPEREGQIFEGRSSYFDVNFRMSGEWREAGDRIRVNFPKLGWQDCEIKMSLDRPRPNGKGGCSPKAQLCLKVESDGKEYNRTTGDVEYWGWRLPEKPSQKDQCAPTPAKEPTSQARISIT